MASVLLVNDNSVESINRSLNSISIDTADINVKPLIEEEAKERKKADTNLQSQIDRLDVNDIKNQVAANTVNIQGLEEEVDNIDTDISVLYSNYETVTNNVEELQEDMDISLEEINESITDLSTSINNVDGSKEDLIIQLTKEQYAEITPAQDQTYLLTNDHGAEIEVLNILYPIGVTYTQYPGCYNPNQLFPGTLWELLNFNGAFFRASNGSSQSFDNQSNPQEPQLPNITGYVGDVLYDNVVPIAQGGSMYLAGGQRDRDWSGTSGSGTKRIVFNANLHDSTYVDDGEVRPRNYTINIWKRIE